MTTAIHPGYTHAIKLKPVFPAEIYSYPAAARRQAEQDDRELIVPTTPLPALAASSLRGLWAAYAALGLALWTLAATAPMGG